MNTPFADRDLTQQEIEKLRLILSTYQDGSGQLAGMNGRTLPGWRDFERTIAVGLGGRAQENKFIFDVLLPDLSRSGIYLGISCKMRRTLIDTQRTGRVTLELSNSSGKFWKEIGEFDLNQQNYKSDPKKVGDALVALVEKWHQEVSTERGGAIDLTKSFYLALSWSKSGQYQLFKFSLKLPGAGTLRWDFPNVKNKNGEEMPGRRLRGMDSMGTVFEWYGESGGQLKYYPLVENALWKSEVFLLQPLPEEMGSQHVSLIKAKAYFPERWTEMEIISKIPA